MDPVKAGLNSVAKRTRKEWEAFYMNQYKHKRGEVSDGFAEKKDEAVVNVDSDSTSAGSSEGEESDYSADCDSSDDDRSYRAYTSGSNDQKTKRKIITRPFKKGKGGAVDRENNQVEIDMLVDSIMSKENGSDKIMKVVLHEKTRVAQSTLPLKFRFVSDDESPVPEKTDREKEIASLFDEMNANSYGSEAVGCTDDDTNDAECTASTDTHVDQGPLANCQRGQHDGLLNDEIGIVCRFCSYLLLDIKSYLKPFVDEPPRKKRYSDYYYKGSSNSSNLDKIPVHGASYGSMKASSESEATVLDLIPGLDKELYPHQLEGFQFLWRNIAGDTQIENLKTIPCNGGRGCIISHAPGTGKTRLAIVFLQSFMKLYPDSRPMIIAPSWILSTWEQEFKKWGVGLNFHNLNKNMLSGDESAVVSGLGLSADCRENEKDFIKLVKLCSWSKGGGVLGISYGLFRRDCTNNDRLKKMLLLLPGLVVMDEAHTVRNDQTLTWKALTKISTQRRVGLTGTIFQNNFTELYNTLSFVNPRFCSEVAMSGASEGKGRKRKSKIEQDELRHLTNSIRESDDKEGIKKLKRLMQPFVHEHKGSILQETLPGLRDCLLLLKPTDLQEKLLQDRKSADNFLEQDHLASLISVHPSLVSEKPGFSEHKKKLKLAEFDPNAGVKTRFLIKLIQLAERSNEKVLVFSQFIDPLIHIKKLLKHHFKWNEGHEMMYVDGEMRFKERQRLINLFNDKGGKATVMLASQRACSEGISLVGASRVVLLDVVWNPSVKTQAISRAYRLGQERIVYVYHLVTSMEVKKHEKQVEKDKIGRMIFDPENWVSKNDNKCDESLFDQVLEAMIMDQGLGSLICKIVPKHKESV